MQSAAFPPLRSWTLPFPSVSDQADAIREGMKTAEKRMKELQKLIEYGKNYTEYKPIHDELKKLKNGWTNKRDKYEEAHRAELTLWNAASRYLHANLPKGTKPPLPISEWEKSMPPSAGREQQNIPSSKKPAPRLPSCTISASAWILR